MRRKVNIIAIIMKQAMLSNTIFEATFENARDAFFVVTPQGEIVEANKAARFIAGKNEQSFQSAQSKPIMAAAAGATAPLPFRIEINGQDFNAFAHRLTGVDSPLVLVKAQPHASAIKLFKDLNDRLTALNQTAGERRRRKAVEASYEELDRFAAIAAHDLNAPLRQIGQVIEMMREDMADKLDSSDLTRFDQIEQRTKRLRKLVTALLEYSRTANTPLTIERICLNDIIAQVREDLMPMIKESGAQIVNGPLPDIDGDPVLTPQLFANLISNGIKYCREDTPPRIRVFHQNDNGLSRFCIEDNGMGVESVFASRIFEPFMRIGNKPEAAGTGVGLAIVKMIAAKHGWSISMDSIVGTGSTVSVTIAS